MFFHFGIKNLVKFRQLKVKNYFIIFSYFFTYSENYFLNDKLIFDVQHDEKYNNSASFEFLQTTTLEKLMTIIKIFSTIHLEL